ncbi:MAG: DUF3160 domain-containing protein [Bacteroidales bacterium]|nr:DUF3160 domain-containing protein [Bacteroidales bacterium]
MIKHKRYITTIILALTWTLLIIGQSTFSPEAYMQFLETHQDYTAQELLGDHPAKTTYYSSRQFPANLSVIPWFDTLNNRFQFTEDEKSLLSQNFFMVSERLGSYDWASAFIDVYSNDLPLFLSTDFILNSLHNSYDAILQTLEWQFLEPNLQVLLHALYDHYPSLVENYAADNRFDDALKDVDLYVSVALSLAEDQKYLPQFDSRNKFDEVMAAIETEQMTYMKLFTESKDRKLDFSQFTPRGHYNKEIYTPDGIVTLENYFKAMMWLGRIDFLLTAPPENPWEPGWTDDELRRMQLGALTLNEALYGCGESDNLVKHEEIISFMVGPDDNMTPGELQELSDRILTVSADIFREETFDSFMAELNASDDYGQKIMSNFFLVDPFTSDPGNLPVSYKLLGQKFLIDSYVFSEVVFDRIVYENKKIWRPLPDPLDAMAALGNEDALALLETELDTYKYASNMAGLKYLIDSYNDEFWEQSLYNTWLNAIRSLNPLPSSTGLPYFMQTTAWHHEKLNTQLTSWAQLRHDNILYGKQSYTGGTGCSFPYTLVEPYPELYGKLSIFAENASDFFGSVFSGEQVECQDRIVNYYQGYAEIMKKLETIAQKELDHIRLSEDEVTFLKTMINHSMASGPAISGWYTDLFFDVEKGLNCDFTVADVHTQPTELNGAVVGKVLHVGNGNVNMGVFLAENPCNPGQYVAYAGPVSSFHTEVTSNFKRLTDQEWEAYFWEGYESFPDRPDWVASYLADQEGKAYPDGRELKGTLYTGTGIDPASEPQLFDYLLIFPNPVSTEAHIRFVLNLESDLNLEVFDAMGRKVHNDLIEDLAPAEHDIALPVHNWQQGIYLLRMGIGNQVVVKEMVVQ